MRSRPLARAAVIAAACGAAACGGADRPPPPLEARTGEGISIAPETPVATPIERVALETVAVRDTEARLGPLAVEVLEAGRRGRGVGRFWPSADAAFFGVRVRISNAGAETETIDPAVAFVLVDAAGTPRGLSDAAAALVPSPLEPVVLAPGDSAVRLVLFPITDAAPAVRLEVYRGSEAAAFRLGTERDTVSP